MFFEENELGGFKRRASLAVLPETPETGWRPPTHFPNLSSAVVIAVDVETKETDFDHGPGWGRGKGHIVGFSLAALDRQGNRGKWYFPVRHEVEPQYNLDPTTCFAWLKTILETPHIPKCGANLLYDIGWLTTENIYTQGELHDVQFAEALLHEDGAVNLEYLSQKYIGRGKTTDLMYQWIRQAYPNTPDSELRGEIWRTSPRLVGFYGEDDAANPLDIMMKQWPMLVEQGIADVYRMECDSIYLLTEMRLTGVNIDLNMAERLYDELAVDIANLYQQLYQVTGVRANVNSGADLAKVFDKVGIPYPRTAHGNPSFTKVFLNSVEHPVAQLIRDIREHDKIRSTFVRSYLLEANVNGRVHCQFHPLRGDDGGTRSGRFSSDKPNLQNIPIRTALGKKIRTAFIPDYGHIAWEKNDYSQIEYRMLAHYAVGPGSEEIRAAYNADPRTDYHNLTHLRLCPFMGWNPEDLDTMKKFRRPIKNINFGLVYGMGKKKLVRSVMEYFKGSLTEAQGNAIYKGYHEANPFVQATMDAAVNEVNTCGYVLTIQNRRARFNKWEPRQINYDNRAMPLRHEQAIRAYGPDIIRAETHKGINYKLQGSAAEMIKRGMVRCHKEGVFRVTGVPKLQVHDELDFSVKDDTAEQREAYAYMRHVLETAIPLHVPVLVDHGRGANWGSID